MTGGGVRIDQPPFLFTGDLMSDVRDPGHWRENDMEGKTIPFLCTYEDTFEHVLIERVTALGVRFRDEMGVFYLPWAQITQICLEERNESEAEREGAIHFHRLQ
jgi:hypothetical protein